MKRLKRVIIVIMLIVTCAVMLVSVSGCGSDGESTTAQTGEFVIARGGGYTIIGMLYSSASVQGRSDLVGVRADNGNWIIPMSPGHCLIDDYGRIRRSRNSLANTVIVTQNPFGQRELSQFEVREAGRRGDIASSYEHLEGSVFSFVRRETSQESPTIITAEYYDVHNCQCQS